MAESRTARSAATRRVALACVIAALVLAAASCSSEPPADAAQRECRAHYDILMRWVSGHGRLPEGDAETSRAAGLSEPDPWGKPYAVEILAGHPHVWSAGPDGKWRTGDEIVYPPVDPGED